MSPRGCANKQRCRNAHLATHGPPDKKKKMATKAFSPGLGFLGVFASLILGGRKAIVWWGGTIGNGKVFFFPMGLNFCWEHRHGDCNTKTFFPFNIYFTFFLLFFCFCFFLTLPLCLPVSHLQQCRAVNLNFANHKKNMQAVWNVFWRVCLARFSQVQRGLSVQNM